MKAFKHRFLSFSQPPALLVLLVLSAYFNWVCPEETALQNPYATTLIDHTRPNSDRVYPGAFGFGLLTSTVFAYGSFSFQAYVRIYNCSNTAAWQQLTRAHDLLPAILSTRLLLIHLPRSQEFIC